MRTGNRGRFGCGRGVKKIVYRGIFLGKEPFFEQGAALEPGARLWEEILTCMLGNVPDMNPNPSTFPLRTSRRMLPTPRFCFRGRTRRGSRLAFGATLLAVALWVAGLSGCSHLRTKPATESVYVTVKQTYLRDRVAAVSNRTATVGNGQRLEVLEHGRRFYRVQTEKGEQGWIDEKAVATQQVFDSFVALGEEHRSDPAVATALVQDEVNLHLKPGRQTEVFYRLPEGDKLQLLKRATLPKPVTAGVVPVKAADAEGAEAVPPIAMEDWWLVRDTHGHVGWLLSHYVEVDAPDTLTRYAEGQRFVGAYVLTTVHDDGADQDNKDIPIYLTVLAPYAAGLPYDFDQVRVFTWNLKMHRYETAFREKNIEGYLPVTLKSSTDPYGKATTAQTPLPTFTYKVLAADAGPVVPDPTTGMVKPGRLIEKTYRLEGNLVRRIALPGIKDDSEAHPAAEEKKSVKGKKK
jgi:SH3-like domain-containing protein